jgi:site-specific DNA recombinase
MGGRSFDKTKLHNLLTNPTYAGKVKYKHEIHDGEHEAIVPTDLWRQVQARLQHNGRTGGAEARNKHGALLRGLLHCGSCGCPMTHTYTKKRDRLYRYYVCAHAQKRGWHTCLSKSVPAGEIERFVVDQISCIGRDPGLAAETLRATNQQVEAGVCQLQRERGILERRLKRDEAALRMAEDPARLADLHDRIAAGQRRLGQIGEEIGTLRDGIVGERELREALARFDDLWAALAPREQVRVIQLLVERIVYDGAAGTVSITFRPTGIRAIEGHEQEAAA